VPADLETSERTGVADRRERDRHSEALNRLWFDDDARAARVAVRSEIYYGPCVVFRTLIRCLSVALAGLALGGCGDEADAPASRSLGHSHGLGVDGDTLYMATHAGLWKAPDGQAQPQPVGQSRQDIEGFSIAGGDRFIGSGHPAPDQDLPRNLGLVESRDGGRTWKNISLLGETDFHVLQAVGKWIYGYDGSRGLLVSSDGGRAWDPRTPPAAMFSLAIDPQNAERIVGATESGLFVSADAGRRWRPVSPKPVGLLAWRDDGRLFLVDDTGAVRFTDNLSAGWKSAGNIGGQPTAFIADGDDLYVALVDASVKRSSDGGRTWNLRAAPSP
jgi:hypothetical protein